MVGTMRLKGKFCGAGLIVVLVGMVLAGCKSSGQATPTAGESTGSAYTSKLFTTSYTGALDASSQLMLGMLKLEGTDNAVTAEQARGMLQVVQASGSGAQVRRRAQRRLGEYRSPVDARAIERDCQHAPHPK
jgi:hypothetical protein